MCGIAGIVGPEATDARVRAMLERMAHRGEPAYRGECWSAPAAAFGTNRLAIQDEPHGRQPVVADSIAVVFNGEIYNASELRAELGGAASFRTGCDTEVVLRAFMAWGDDFVTHLRGMFAIAVLDGDALVLARDPLGIKPLYVTADGCCFGSELKGLVAARSDAPLREVAPGVVWRDGRAHRYWSLPPFNAADEELEVAPLAEELAGTVRSHLPAGGPLACLLSGGVDSSTVTMLAALQHGGDVEAWTLAAPGVASDDFDAARTVCDRLGIPLRVCRPTADELTAFYCARGAWMTETWEPALVRNAVSYHFLCRAVRAAGHKLCLSGEGADEVFGGYDYLRLLAPERRDEAIEDSLRNVHRTYLQMADRAAMAATLELRVPYMDGEFVTAAAALPPQGRMTADANKCALRSMFPDAIPDAARLRAKVGMNAGAGYGSNDPDDSIYHRGVVARYRRDVRRRRADHAVADAAGGPFGVNLADPEEVHNFARYVEHGYDRLERRPRPQLNVSHLAAPTVGVPT